MKNMIKEMLCEISYETEAVCKICGNNSAIFDAVDFNKFCSENPYHFGLSGITIPYFRCSHCQLIFSTLQDNLTNSQVAELIYNKDYILVDPEYNGARAKDQANSVSKLLGDLFEIKILDYGSGNNVFAEEMKKRGYRNVVSYDPYSKKSKIPKGKYDLITCFEVLEHTPTPIKTMQNMKSLLSKEGLICIGTATQPKNINEIRARWWYVAPRNGHVTIYSEYSLCLLAEKLQLKYINSGCHYFMNSSTSSLIEKTSLDLSRNHKKKLTPNSKSTSPTYFHEYEFAKHVPFQWTAVKSIVWKDELFFEGITTITIPFLMEVEEGFTSKSKILISDTEVNFKIEDNMIIAEFISEENLIFDVTLLTPEPIQPSKNGVIVDNRYLGIGLINE